MNPTGGHATIDAAYPTGDVGMKILTQSLLLACLSVAAGTSMAAGPDDVDVMQSMSAADFRALGLDKLSDAQIKALGAWIGKYQQQHTQACDAAAATASAPAAAETYPLSAHIVGEFHGWSGSSRVILDNGEVWEQIDDAMVTSGRMTNPKVTVTRGLLNSFYMSVEGVDDSVQVRRIRH